MPADRNAAPIVIRGTEITGSDPERLRMQKIARGKLELKTQPIDRAQGGLGIGLTIVRMLVEQHGGRVSAHHSDGRGKGSEFVVRLPASAEMTRPAPAGA